MNFLGHILLSGSDEDIIAGNIIADAIKGTDYKKFPQKIAQGIVLHRKIDTFTDQNRYFKNSTRRLHPEYHKYAGVISDIFYDHFLAANWHEFSDVPLADLAHDIYELLLKKNTLIPGLTRKILPFMIFNNWLVSYRRIDHLRKVFYNMDKRTGFASKMQTAPNTLLRYYEDFYQDFTAFMKDILKYVDRISKAPFDPSKTNAF